MSDEDKKDSYVFGHVYPNDGVKRVPLSNEQTEFEDHTEQLNNCVDLFRTALTIISGPDGLVVLVAYIDSMRSDPKIYAHMPGMAKFFRALADAVDRKHKEWRRV